MAIIGSDEIYTKISSLVEAQFPEFMREDGPRFVAFLKAYYEFLERSTSANGPGAVHATRSLYDYNDIDRTLDAFIEEFRKEFMVNIPERVQVDKRLLTKYIQDFYKARGSQNSYKLMFRALFDTEVDFYYPGADILRASDGRWERTTTLFVGPPFVGSPASFSGRLITSSGGATARVQEVNTTLIQGIKTFYFVVENVSGQFQEGEIIEDETNTLSAEVLSSVGAVVDVSIFNGGGYHNVGDTVRITGQSSGATGTARVISTGVSNSATITIVDGGSGYEIGANTTLTITGIGSGLSATITALANTSTANLATQTIQPAANVTLNCSGAGAGSFSGLGQNTAILTSVFASANMESTLLSAFDYTDVTLGAIRKIKILNTGSGYTTLPGVTARNQRIIDLNLPSASYSGALQGADAILVSNTVPGSILSVEIISGGSTFQKDENVTLINTKTKTDIDDNYLDRDGLTKSTTRQTHYDAQAIGKVSAVVTNPGKYISTRGFLSWDKKLQDNYYYQEYSYVLKANRKVSEYRNVIKQVLHPAGTMMFGQYEMALTANVFPTSVVVLPLNLAVEVSEAAVANASLVGYASRIANSAESFSATETVVSYASRIANTAESITSTDSEVVQLTAGGTVTESVTTTDSEVVQLTAGGTVTESVTSTDSQVPQIDVGGTVTESVTSTDSQVPQIDVGGTVTESVTSADQQIVTLYKLDPNYISVQYANDIIQAHQSVLISAYQTITIATFDGTARLVYSVAPNDGTTATFANGNLRANTGTISVGGYGSNLIVVPVGDTWDGSSIYTVNTIFSNTAFSLRNEFLPVTSNAIFSYSTSS